MSAADQLIRNLEAHKSVLAVLTVEMRASVTKDYVQTRKLKFLQEVHVSLARSVLAIYV